MANESVYEFKDEILNENSFISKRDTIKHLVGDDNKTTISYLNPSNIIKSEECKKGSLKIYNSSNKKNYHKNKSAKNISMYNFKKENITKEGSGKKKQELVKFKSEKTLKGILKKDDDKDNLKMTQSNFKINKTNADLGISKSCENQSMKISKKAVSTENLNNKKTISWSNYDKDMIKSINDNLKNFYTFISDNISKQYQINHLKCYEFISSLFYEKLQRIEEVKKGFENEIRRLEPMLDAYNANDINNIIYNQLKLDLENDLLEVDKEFEIKKEKGINELNCDLEMNLKISLKNDLIEENSKLIYDSIKSKVTTNRQVKSKIDKK